MPNWCECDLTIEGPKELVREFLEFAKGPEGLFDFNRFIPYPERFIEQDRRHEAWMAEKPWVDRTPAERESPDSKDGFNSGGYEWCAKNWGTKWNACRTSVEDQEEFEGTLEVLVTFETAWAPPLPVIKAAAVRFPGLVFDLRYFEGGAQVNGCYQCDGGKVTYDESGPYFGNRGG